MIFDDFCVSSAIFQITLLLFLNVQSPTNHDYCNSPIVRTQNMDDLTRRMEAELQSVGSCDDSSNNDDGVDELAESTGHSHTGNDCAQSSSGGSMSKEMGEIEAIAREDSRMLRNWRKGIALTILCTFVAVTTGATIFLKNDEEQTTHQDVRPCNFSREHTLLAYRFLDSDLTQFVLFCLVSYLRDISGRSCS